jgi:predicted transcriptional regulator
VGKLSNPHAAPRLILDARTAADLMTPNPVSIGRQTPVRDTAAFLTARGISAAPVIDDAGRPVGVVSSTDILVRCQTMAAVEAPVSAVMTPVVFCARADATAEEVVEKMLGLNVRRLFVVDADGVVVGVIAARDVLRKLRRRGRRVPGDDGGGVADGPAPRAEVQVY